MKTRTILKSLALAMLMPAMLLTTACSNSDNEIINGETANTKGYTLPVTINVTRQGAAATRAIYDESTRKLSFSTGDKLFIEGYQEFAGILTMVSDGKFSGEILTKTPYTGTVEELFASASELNAYLLPAGYENYGFLNIFNPNTYQAYLYYDNNKVFALTKKEAVEQLSFEKHWDYDTSLKGFELMPGNAILNFTISGLAANTAVTVSFIHTDYEEVATPVDITTDASGVATFAAAMYNDENFDDYSLTVDGTAIALPENTYVEAGKIYNISRSVAPAGPTLSLTNPAVGQVIGSDGKNYDAGSVPTGVTAVAMIAYVSGSNGLAVALDYLGSGSSDYEVTYANVQTHLDGLTAFSGGTWRLATKDEWVSMLVACKVDGDSESFPNNKIMTCSGFWAKMAAAGWPDRASIACWTSTTNGDNMWCVIPQQVVNKMTFRSNYAPTEEKIILPVLAF